MTIGTSMDARGEVAIVRRMVAENEAARQRHAASSMILFLIRFELGFHVDEGLIDFAIEVVG